jgi:hypothetical protein
MKLPVRKIVGHSFVIAIIIIFILIISKPPAEPTAEQPAAKEKLKKELNQFDGSDLDIENDGFRLHFDGRYGSVHIVDKKTGQSWDSVPDMNKSVPPNNQRFIHSPIYVRYTEGKGNTQTYPFKEEGSLKARLIDGGKAIRAEISLIDIRIAFALEYRLTDDGLVVKVP